MMKNPKWSYNELILALELYIKFKPNPPSKNSTEIGQLSTILRLNALADGIKINKIFRNKNGVAMKLQNFRRFDPLFKGTGLRAGGNLEFEIWNKYKDPKKLKKIAQKIRDNIEIKMKDKIYAK